MFRPEISVWVLSKLLLATAAAKSVGDPFMDHAVLGLCRIDLHAADWISYRLGIF
jgi:hypothetical protein